MAHKTLIGGTSYDISGGKTLIGGAGYSIKGGRTLIGGTGYGIGFSIIPPIGTSLNDCTWEQVRAISDAGLASAYFRVGDAKELKLSGVVGNISVSGTYYCYIIGIDHNSNYEGTNRIHFQFGRTALGSGNSLAFVDGSYGNFMYANNWFNMNTSNTNEGGWARSNMRNTTCPAFKNAMPSDLQAVLKTVTKYSDNTGGGSNTASYVTATSDEVFLLSEFEVFGTRKYANSAEQNYQAQYAWYSAGNSKLKYAHNNTGWRIESWFRSAYYGSMYCFCLPNGTKPNASYSDAAYTMGFAPAFCV